MSSNFIASLGAVAIAIVIIWWTVSRLMKQSMMETVQTIKSYVEVKSK